MHELAQHLHEEKGTRRGDEVINMDSSDDPTSAVGFYFNPAAGEGGIIMATVGASHDENGLEGVRFLFNPSEAAAAQTTLLSELHSMDAEVATGRTPTFTVI